MATHPIVLLSINDFLLIYLNPLPRILHSDVKLFVNNTSLFSVIEDIDASFSKQNDDLMKIQDWLCKWKMSFNRDRAKQAEESMF